MIDRRLFIAGGVALATLPPRSAIAQNCSGRGRYLGTLDLRALPGGGQMRLLKPYAYQNACGYIWSVPAGVDLDGASIPQIFKSITGGAWDGAYRDASVIHDWFCITKSRPWRATHRVFYDGMITSGVSRGKAGVMYAAVMIGGPKWPEPNLFNAKISAQLGQRASDYQIETASSQDPDDVQYLAAVSKNRMSEGEFRILAEHIEQRELNPDQIDAIVIGH